MKSLRTIRKNQTAELTRLKAQQNRSTTTSNTKPSSSPAPQSLHWANTADIKQTITRGSFSTLNLPRIGAHVEITNIEGNISFAKGKLMHIELGNRYHKKSPEKSPDDKVYIILTVEQNQQEIEQSTAIIPLKIHWN